MTTGDVVNKLWGFCHVLRHDGIDYGDYIEQLTYLLFIKMADERGAELPEHTDWPYLRKQSGSDLLDAYVEALRTLGKEHGILGDIFSGSQSRFGNPVSLQKLIGLIDETEWTAIDTDVKAAAFEGLLEKAASEGKKGAGQYFTPRILIRTMVRCIKPDPRVSKDFKICDPAVGTGGFLIAAYEWLKAETKGGALDRDTAKRIRNHTYYGNELVQRPRRLALMNLYLHQVEPHITLGDSIYETPGSQRYDVILMNPPFGTKGAAQAPDREDFVVQTSNKQLNFLQHILTTLKKGGRAAVVVPDNVLFAQQAGEVFQVLMEDCDVHTVLRCPRGTFSPYTEGTKTNVIFFTKGKPTECTWIYDARSNVPKITKKSRPLTAKHFTEFEKCYGDDPNGLSKRSEKQSAEGRWRSFTLEEIKEKHYKLDAFKWLRDEELDDADELLDPQELITEAMEELLLSVDDLADIQQLLEGNGVEADRTTANAASAAAHCSNALRAIERFRQAVLAAACSGRLTADWRDEHPELTNPPQARSVTPLIDVPESWAWTTLGELSEIRGGIQVGAKRKGTEPLREVPYLRVANVQKGWLDLSEIKTIAAPESKIEALRLRPGDIFFNEGGDRDKLGRGWVWEGQIEECIHQNHVFRARLQDRAMQPRFFSWYGNTFGMLYFFDQGKQTVNLASLSKTKLSQLPVPVPSVAEQAEIVRRVDSLLRGADHVQRRTKLSSKDVEATSQAALAKPFRGELSA